ncbi:hypothetical protein AB6E04_14855 [Vibrio amylolyticus]|uniref:hypothetical protein n=1 Tax=Vibrio amylolyticus TaxID=2847292 RepID=UPI0035540FF7
MTDKHNRPKNIPDLGVSFEERLAQLGKLSKQSRSDGSGMTVASNRYPTQNQHRQSGLQNTPHESHRMSNSRDQKALDEYKEKGQSKQILKVWFMLMQAFDSKMKQFFGDEPDIHFMKFAATLTPESYKRLEANLLERLDEDREWPPSLIRLRQLANSPTKESMYKARQRLFHFPVPNAELDRVEAFIKKYKMREVRSFSERNFESEFNRKYTQWFREVILDDMDIYLEEQSQKISTSLNEDNPTENDKRRDDLIAKGQAFDHTLGQRIQKMLQEKSAAVEIEDIGEEEATSLSKRN